MSNLRLVREQGVKNLISRGCLTEYEVVACDLEPSPEDIAAFFVLLTEATAKYPEVKILQDTADLFGISLYVLVAAMKILAPKEPPE